MSLSFKMPLKIKKGKAKLASCNNEIRLYLYSDLRRFLMKSLRGGLKGR